MQYYAVKQLEIYRRTSNLRTVKGSQGNQGLAVLLFFKNKLYKPDTVLTPKLPGTVKEHYVLKGKVKQATFHDVPKGGLFLQAAANVRLDKMETSGVHNGISMFKRILGPECGF